VQQPIAECGRHLDPDYTMKMQPILSVVVSNCVTK